MILIYTKVTPDDAREIVSEHIMKGRKVERLLFKDPATKKPVTTEKELASHKKQIRIVLRNCGIIDPENIEDAIAHDGYEALGKVLTTMKPLDVIKIIKDSGLQRQRGWRISDRTEMGNRL